MSQGYANLSRVYTKASMPVRELPRYLQKLDLERSPGNWTLNQQWGTRRAFFRISVGAVAFFFCMFMAWQFIRMDVLTALLFAMVAIWGIVISTIMAFLNYSRLSKTASAVGYTQGGLFFRYGTDRVDVWGWNEIENMSVQSTQLYLRTGKGHGYNITVDLFHLEDSNGTDWLFSSGCEPSGNVPAAAIKALKGWRY
jgi:hypothetical protein